MSAPRLLALVGAFVVVLVILGSTLSTGALWSGSISLGAGKVSSGTLRLVNGDATTQTSSWQMKVSGNNLQPGDSAQEPLVMKNNGDADLRYALNKPAAATNADPALAGQLGLSVRVVANTAACASGVNATAASGTEIYNGTAIGATTTLRPITAGANETLCLRLTINSDAAPQVSQTALVLPFTAEQQL